MSSDHPKQFMNGANKDSGKSNGDSMKQASAPQASTGSGNLDAAKLTAIVEENRIRINKGWEELRRLDQVLASLDALKTRVQSNAVNPAASAPPQQPDPASIIAKSE